MVKIGSDLNKVYGVGYGSTIYISVVGKPINGTNWLPLSRWELKTNLSINFNIIEAKLTSTGAYYDIINGSFYIHSGYPNSNTNDNKSLNYKNEENSITSFYSWKSTPRSSNPTSASVSLNGGDAQTIDIFCDSSSKTGSTSGGGGGIKPPSGFEQVTPTP